MLDNQHIQSLLHQIGQKDDKQAFSIFFDHYYTRMIRLAKIYVANHHYAEDIVSEVLIKFLKKRKDFFKVEHFEAYLFFAVKNQSFNFLDSQKKESKLSSIDEESDYLTSQYTNPIDKIIEQELTDLISLTVEKLPPKRKLVYQFIKDEDLTAKQVAELLEISERTVEVHLRLAIRFIREAVAHYMSGKKKYVAPVMKIARVLLPLAFIFTV
mgnify:CR=1 FL=1